MNIPKVGLALGSGGARGFAHLGVIKVFADAGIPIDVIAGSSMGALVGSFYAAGQSVDNMYKIAKAFKRKYYLDFTVPRMGFITGKRTKELIEIFTYGKNIEETNIPFAAVATDLLSGKRVVFKEGNIAEAVRASISIPGVFIPVKKNGMLLVDGGVSDRIPVSVARELGADIVIGVDVSPISPTGDIGTILDVFMQSIDILQYELSKSREDDSDLMLRPQVKQFSSRSFNSIEQIVRLGEQEAEKYIDDIKQQILNWEEP